MKKICCPNCKEEFNLLTDYEEVLAKCIELIEGTDFDIRQFFNHDTLHSIEIPAVFGGVSNDEMDDLQDELNNIFTYDERDFYIDNYGTNIEIRVRFNSLEVENNKIVLDFNIDEDRADPHELRNQYLDY